MYGGKACFLRSTLNAVLLLGILGGVSYAQNAAGPKAPPPTSRLESRLRSPANERPQPRRRRRPAATGQDRARP